MKIRFLKSQAVSELYTQVQDNLDQYRTGNFDFLEQDISLYFEGQLEIDESSIEKIKCDKKDFKEVENCKLMLDSLKDITPYLARDERLWVYLTHTLLLNYARTRWEIPVDDEKAIKHIRSHFFARGARGIERGNAASRLWWMAHLCSRVKSLSLDDSLKAFLFMTDVRAGIIERPSTCQSITVFETVIKMLKESLEGDQKLFKRNIFRPFMMELNLQGGVKLLDSLPEREIRRIAINCVS